MKRIFLSLLALCAMQFFALSVQAQGFVVGTPTVNEGVLWTEARVSLNLDNETTNLEEAYIYRQFIDYGFSDDFALRLTLEQDDLQDQDFDHNNFQLESRFQLFDNENHGFEGGFRITYINRDTGPDEISTLWAAEKFFGHDKSWSYRHNFLVNHQLGADSRSGLIFTTRSSLRKKVSFGQIGFESFSDFGLIRDLSGFSDQIHTVGPMVNGTIFNNAFGYQVSIRQGISRAAADQTFFIGIVKNF